MKKLLLIVSIFFLAGCQEVSDLIKIQNANKDVTEMQLDMTIESETEVADELIDELGFDSRMQLGMEVSMEVSNGVTHSYSTVDVFGLSIVMEQYSLVQEGQRVVYTNFFDVWTKEVAEESELMNLQFDAGEFLKALTSSFEIIDPITIDEKELTQMEIIMTLEQVQNVFGLDYSSDDMTEEELIEQLGKEIIVVLGYTEDTYLIERIDIDLTEMFDSPDNEEVVVSAFHMIFTMSRHNEIGEIELPAEALVTDFIK